MIQSLSLLVHAGSKVGKSTLGATLPYPLCIADAEGGTKFLSGSPYLTARNGRPLSVVAWNPAEAPPDMTNYDVASVQINTWGDVQLMSRWLQSGQHPFRGLTVDSITEVQRRCKANLKGTDALQIQDWGQLLALMDAEIRGLRDLANNPHNPLEVVMFIAETRLTDNKWIPYMQGQISISLPYMVDICGVLWVGAEPDADGQLTVPVRQLLVSPHPQYEAGERVQGAVGPLISRPDVEQIFHAVYPNTNTQEQPPV